MFTSALDGERLALLLSVEKTRPSHLPAIESRVYLMTAQDTFSYLPTHIRRLFGAFSSRGARPHGFTGGKIVASRHENFESYYNFPYPPRFFLITDTKEFGCEALLAMYLSKEIICIACWRSTDRKMPTRGIPVLENIFSPLLNFEHYLLTCSAIPATRCRNANSRANL